MSSLDCQISANRSRRLTFAETTRDGSWRPGSYGTTGSPNASGAFGATLIPGTLANYGPLRPPWPPPVESRPGPRLGEFTTARGSRAGKLPRATHPKEGPTVASIGHQGWRQVKTNLAAKIDGRVAPPLAELVERVGHLQDEIAELKDIVTVQADIANQTTELVGRLLATASSRLDSLEDSLRQLSGTQECQLSDTEE